MNNPERIRSWLMLRMTPGLSDARLYRLLQTFGSPEKVFASTTQDLTEVGGCHPAHAKAILRGPDPTGIQAVERELEKLSNSNIQVLTCLDREYPSRLKTIHDPPILLYITGTLPKLEGPVLALVGSRRATVAGRLLTEEMSQELASIGFTIVSGLARGIDAAAHRGALKGGGVTVGILGCGIDRTYPPEHTALRQEIEANGSVISEFSLGAPPHAYHFPKRNRIISGVSLGVLVTQASLRSGSLITARLAAEQGREVFAVPGSIKEEYSKGPHGLIKQGAKLVEHVGDILDELMPHLGEEFQKQAPTQVEGSVRPGPPLKADEALVYNILSHEPLSLDEVIVQSGLSAGLVSSLLLTMELKGLIRSLPGSFVVRV